MCIYHANKGHFNISEHDNFDDGNNGVTNDDDKKG